MRKKEEIKKIDDPFGFKEKHFTLIDMKVAAWEGFQYARNQPKGESFNQWFEKWFKREFNT
jgi:hypothetical protein